MTRSTAAFILLIAFPVGQIAVAGDNKQPLAAAEIVSKHIAAIGGKDVLAKFKTRVAIGTVAKENEAASQMSIMSEAPNRVSAIYVFRRLTWQLTYDGAKAIYRPVTSGIGQDIAHKYEDVMATGLAFNDISLYNLVTGGESERIKFEAKGTKKLNGRATYIVEVKRAKGGSSRLYFDAETFMWVRTDFGSINLTPRVGQLTNNPIPHGEDDTTIDFFIETSDFREVEGVKLPFKFVQVATAPILEEKRAGTITGTITEYRHNIAIDPKMFQ